MLRNKGELWLPRAVGGGKGGCPLGIEFQLCEIKKLWRSVEQQGSYSKLRSAVHLKMFRIRSNKSLPFTKKKWLK